MQRTVALLKNYEFSRVYRQGQFLNSRQLSLYYLKRKDNKLRLGITVSRKVKGNVQRNRIKRLLREVYRLSEDQIRDGYDIILLGRQDPQNCNFWDLRQDFFNLSKKAGLRQE